MTAGMPKGQGGASRKKLAEHPAVETEIWHRDTHTQPDKKYAASVGWFKGGLKGKWFDGAGLQLHQTDWTVDLKILRMGEVRAQ